MKIGDKHPHKGHKQSIETRNKISKENKGKHRDKLGKKLSQETKQKMSRARKGIKFSNIHRENLRKAMKRIGHRPFQPIGFKHSEESKKKIGDSEKGDKHWNWRGGITNFPYPFEFNSELKKKIRERDNYICCLCKRTEREELEEFNKVLSVNHIDFDKNNCKESNLNTLCCRCNTKINRNREYWTEYFNNLQTL